MARRIDQLQDPELLAELLSNISWECYSGGEGYCHECPLNSCCRSEHLIKQWLIEDGEISL